MCNNEEETLGHFLLDCEKLQDIRNPVISDLLRECEAVCQKLDIRTFDTSLLEIIVDYTCILDTHPNLKQKIYIRLSSIQLGFVIYFMLQDTSGRRFSQREGKICLKLVCVESVVLPASRQYL